MVSLPVGRFGAPTALAGLPALLAYAQSLGLERWLHRRTRGVPTLVQALVWLVLAWRGTGRPHRLSQVDEPLLGALLGRVPCAKTLRDGLGRFPARAVRVAVDAHQVPYWGR